MPETSRNELGPRQRLVSLLVLSAMLLYGIAGMLPSVPVGSWQMFMTADRYTYTLVDRESRPIDLRRYSADNYYLVNHQFPAHYAQWLAGRHPELAPLSGTVTHHLNDGTQRLYRFRSVSGNDVTWEPQ